MKSILGKYVNYKKEDDIEKQPKPTNVESKSSFDDYLGFLLFSRTQSHYWHFQTDSINVHKILNEYYDSIVDQLDTLAEVHLAKNKIKVCNDYSFEDYDNECCMKHFELLLSKTEELLDNDKYKRYYNLLDEIYALGSKTIYLLSLC